MNERKTTRSRFVAAWVLLLAGLATAACSKPEEKTSMALLDQTERTAIVFLELDSSNQPVRIIGVVTDDPRSQGTELALSRSKGEHAHWGVNPPWVDVQIRIGLKEKSPDPFNKEALQHFPRHVFSPKVSKDAGLSSDKIKYEYWVKVHDNKANKDLPPLDPTIRVDP